ncbi:stage II sporulation protein M [Piscinibacter koreensis]|uniref:Stage II sporulation protein M n=1 Tax=Piscinibacter koreensis TaxID=2742824 RepID=A0A7Y6NLN6_9BURK|nr:stage II sporulation protein M [Schlegelella koreensis]NUZ05424.1 stage II sporulation protein M [Schlegelella koreensis]
MTTPLRFEAEHADAWRELEDALENLARWRRRGTGWQRPDPARVAALYRAACEHLAIAQARAYPRHLVERLEALTQRAHEAVYRRSELGLARLARLFAIEFPAALRRHPVCFWLAAAGLALPMLAIGVACWLEPTFVLTVHDAAAVRGLDAMYGDRDEPIGRSGAEADWLMFGHYVRNNVSIAFQCFASGLFAGIGSLFCLLYNGISIGAVAGYLTQAGHARNFYSFVVTHGAFELTGIVVSGAAGLLLGGALIAPGRRDRLDALQHAARDAVLLVAGAFGMLVVAAALEAFWSAARWIDAPVKLGVGAACWIGIAAYLALQGRPRRASAAGASAGASR